MLSVKKSIVIQEASEIKSFIEKNKKIPKSCKLTDGTVLSPYSISYLMACIIQDKLKNEKVDLADVIVYNSSKYSDTINGEEVKRDDYLKMINNFMAFCKKNKRVPSYITTQKSRTKVSFELFMYCLSKIIVWYQKNKTLPNYCIFMKGFCSNTTSKIETVKNNTTKPTSSSKKTSNIAKVRYVSQPHYLVQGCNRLGQCTGYYCGVHIIIQILKKFGISKYTEKMLAAYAGTTTAGSSHQGILTAIAKVSKETGIKLTAKWANFSSFGKTDAERFEAIGKLMEDPNTAVAWHIGYVNGGQSTSGKIIGHYEALDIINVKTKYVRVLNSLGSKKSDGSYTGRLQDRRFNVQAYYARNTPGGQPAVLIVKKG